GKHVVLQGVGKVGYAFASHLVAAGCRVSVVDVNPKSLARATTELGVEALEPGTEFDTECDVFAPCALGAQLNDETIPRLQCRMVLGSANNQLATPRAAKQVADRGILFVPDFVVNAGGVINIWEELQPGGYSETRAMRHVDAIYDRTMAVLEASRDRGIDPVTAAE